ncbi:hypothetical protein JC881_03075 [Variovorax sp. IB41]|nr:hypothetical protein [Variovorax sp. IB41]
MNSTFWQPETAHCCSICTRYTARALAALVDLQRVVALVASHAKRNRRTSIDTKTASASWLPAAALLLLSLAGCASNTQTTPPLIASRPQPTSLPASVSRIDPQPSRPWPLEVESFLNEADSLLKGETTKCSFCSAP